MDGMQEECSTVSVNREDLKALVEAFSALLKCVVFYQSQKPDFTDRNLDIRELAYKQAWVNYPLHEGTVRANGKRKLIEQFKEQLNIK